MSVHFFVSAFENCAAVIAYVYTSLLRFGNIDVSTVLTQPVPKQALPRNVYGDMITIFANSIPFQSLSFGEDLGAEEATIFGRTMEANPVIV